MISPLVEASRIKYSLRGCKERSLEVYEPQDLVKKAVSEFGDSLAVSCSFGSCSIVVLHMALQVKPDIKVVFNNTGVEYPETYAYRTLLKEEWNLNLIETKPEKSFWECVEEYGFPLIRSTGNRKNHFKPRCCIFLKEKPMAKACKEFGIEASMTGLRCAESGVRMYTLAQRGQAYHTKKWGSLWRFHPIGFWSHKQVWDYLETHKIPINEIYSKGKDRSGCMPCTGFLHWEKQLAKANLKMYRYVQKLRKVPLIDDFLKLEDQAYHDCDQVSPSKKQAFIEEWF